MNAIDSPSHAGSGTGALAGLRVLELGQIMAGPVCGMMLADLGADVIKVEKSGGGDDARGYREPRINGVSAPFLMLNRNKRSVVIDLQREQGKALLKKMVETADVVIENFRLGTMEKLGLGYDELSRINPRLIYCAISGYGRSGPLAEAGGFDLIAQGFSGLMSITGEPGGRPLRNGNSVCDVNAGLLAAFGILAAVRQRERTGLGQVVDTSLFEAGLQQLYWHAAIYFATGESAGGTGAAHVLIAPYEAFATGDQWIIIGGANERNWVRVAQILGHPEWVDDARFASNDARMRNSQALREAITEVLVKQPAAYWLQAFDAAGVPCGPIHSVGQALSHPQAIARGMLVEQAHPSAGSVRSVGLPVKLSHSPMRNRNAAPMLGEHSREVLREYGFGESQIDEMIAVGAVAVQDVPVGHGRS